MVIKRSALTSEIFARLANWLTVLSPSDIAVKSSRSIAAKNPAELIKALLRFCRRTVSTLGCLSSLTFPAGKIGHWCRPGFGPVLQRATKFNFFNHLECPPQDGCLLALVRGFPEIVPHWEVEEQASRWLDLNGQIPAGRNIGCRNTGFFYTSTYQTHGLVVERSGGRGD